MKSRPLVMDHFSTVHTSFIVDFKFTSNITILTGDSGTGKTLAFSFIRECMAVNPKLLCFNYLDYQNDMKDMISKADGKLIVIDNADILLNDDTRKYISLDDRNQYLIIGRNPKNLFATKENLFELVSQKVGEQTKFTIKEYLQIKNNSMIKTGREQVRNPHSRFLYEPDERNNVYNRGGYMRMYGYLREPYPCNSTKTVYKVMIHEIDKVGVYTYYYTDSDVVFSSYDSFSKDLETAMEEFEGKLDDRGWIMIEDPLPYCQYDSAFPIRVKGQETGHPQWGSYEIFSAGQWVEYNPTKNTYIIYTKSKVWDAKSRRSIPL